MYPRRNGLAVLPMLDRRFSHVNPDEGITPAQELARVMAEVVGALGGTASVLTLHPTGRPAEVLYADGDELAQITTGLLLAGSLDWRYDHPDHHIWVMGGLEPDTYHGIAMPVRQVPGHSRLVITVFFATLDDEARAVAEAAYLARRPFAIGYFRLWQQDRLYRRDVEILQTALDRVGLAIFLVTKAGELAFANTAGRGLLEKRDGLYEQRRRLHASGRADNVALEAALDHVIDAGGNNKTLPLLIVEREGAAPLTISIVPSPFTTTEQGEVGAIVFAVDPDMDIKDLTAAVCRAYGLTRVETELAYQLASGRTLQEATTSMRLKSETTKGYLRSVFSKMGVSRQPDLIRLILVSLMRTSDDLEFELANPKDRSSPIRISAVQG